MAKNKGKTISDQIGPVRVDHHAYLVRTGKLDLAVQFFVEELHWVEYRQPVSGDWGTARFLKLPHTDSRIQLTEDNTRPADLVECSDNQHLALDVMIVTAEKAAVAIGAWAAKNRLGKGLKIEKADAEGTKWFVYLPKLFTFAVEVVEVKAFLTPY